MKTKSSNKIFQTTEFLKTDMFLNSSALTLVVYFYTCLMDCILFDTLIAQSFLLHHATRANLSVIL